MERKCFICEGFEHIAHNYRNMKEEKSIQRPSNRFEVLRDRVIQREEESERKNKVYLNFINIHIIHFSAKLLH